MNSFDTPARQAFVVKMVEDRSDLPNAIALNSTMVNGSRMIGPAIGGLLIAGFGEGWCFMMLEELHDGFRYVSRFLPIRTALLLLALVSTMGMPYTVLMPAVAREILHGGPHTYGFLLTASGMGAMVGALYLASRTSVVGLERAIAASACAFGVGLIAFALSRTLWLSLLVLPIAGGGMMITMASTNTFLQTIVEERLRGRVMAFYVMAFLGTAPIGSLLAGIVANRVGVPTTILIGGAACIAGGLAFGFWLPRFRALVHPIYIARGIMPEPEALNTTAG